MRKLFLVLLVVGFAASSCKKYKLKQPAYLHFSWDFFNQSAGAHKPVISEGYFYVDKVNVYGARVEGPEVAIEQTLPVVQTSFASQGDLNLSVDVPVGEYNEFEVTLNVVKEGQTSLVLRGAYDFAGDNSLQVVPFVIEWVNPVVLKFRPGTDFTLDKKEDYKLTVGVDVDKLFATMDHHDWLMLTVSSENGGNMILSREPIVGQPTTNGKLFMAASANLEDALILTVQPQ